MRCPLYCKTQNTQIICANCQEFHLLRLLEVLDSTKNEVFHWGFLQLMWQNRSFTARLNQNVTDKRLRTINFKTDNIEKIIESLNPNKAHGHDNISIRMFKICGDTICKPLELVFKQALTTGLFPFEWTKGNIVFVKKKATNKILKITVQFRYFLSAEIFLKDSYLMKSLVFFCLTISQHLLSLVLNQVTLVLISSISYSWNLFIFWWWIWR